MAKYDPKERAVYIHDPRWAFLVDPSCDGPCWWGVVLHEFAHYLDDVWCNQTGHTPEMYALATALALYEDLPLGEYERDERKYKPQSYSRGKKAAGVAILANYREGAQ